MSQSTVTTTATDTETVEGILELLPDGYGFLRKYSMHCGAMPGDAYVANELIRRFDLRGGVRMAGQISAPGMAMNMPPMGQNHRIAPAPGFDRRRGPQGRPMGPPQRQRSQGPRLQLITSIEGQAPDNYRGRPAFDKMTAVDPTGWLRLETTSDRHTTRVIDLFTPIGKGQRGLIVAPPRSGKTILLQHMAEAISTNHPEVELIVLLIDERPEEVTEMRRTVNGTVFASSNDHEATSHVRLAQLVIERAKRLVEMGRDVVVLLDSITRLARAYNKQVGTGRTMSGGLDIKAMDIPKRLFGSARATDGGGSLTVIATALIETGSRMDDVIFQEFKGTGNMELVLDRRLAERRVFPAIDLLGSGTRKEERLLSKEDLERITLLRRSLHKLNPIESMESLLKQMAKYPTNREFLDALAKYLD